MNWKPIIGWEGLYEAHPDGRIRSLDRILPVGHWTQRKAGRILVPSPRGRYLAVCLAHGDRRAHRYVHHIIAETFIGPRPDGLVTCHNDGDLTNNAATNLRYDTRTNNNRDAVRHGTNPLANRSHCSEGHEYTPENTRYLPSRKGRTCITCARKRGAEHMRRKRAAQRKGRAA